jgi:hypothetical protein
MSNNRRSDKRGSATLEFMVLLGSPRFQTPIITSAIKQGVLGRTNRLISFDTTRTAYKTSPSIILLCCGNAFTELLPSNDMGIHKQTHASYNSSIVACIRYHGNVFTEPFPSNDRRDTRTGTQIDGRGLWSTSLRWAQVPWYTYQVS